MFLAVTTPESETTAILLALEDQVGTVLFDMDARSDMFWPRNSDAAVWDRVIVGLTTVTWQCCSVWSALIVIVALPGLSAVIRPVEETSATLFYCCGKLGHCDLMSWLSIGMSAAFPVKVPFCWGRLSLERLESDNRFRIYRISLWSCRCRLFWQWSLHIHWRKRWRRPNW